MRKLHKQSLNLEFCFEYLHDWRSMDVRIILNKKTLKIFHLDLIENNYTIIDRYIFDYYTLPNFDKHDVYSIKYAYYFMKP